MSNPQVQSKIMLILTGPKHSGKTSAGLALRDITGKDFIDIDAFIEELEGRGVRELYRQGRDVFQAAEARAVSLLIAGAKAGNGTIIAAAGGGLIDNEAAVKALAEDGRVVFVYLDVSAATAWRRIEQAARKGGLPSFLDTENPRETHAALHERRAAAYKKLSNIIIDAEEKTPAQIAAQIARHIKT
ncbi:MAG: shikimate kinase [Spirochaetaceae bacterium]|jgi:shikimate kinase|nr:shikimate kinase [Spirochaetaceae bacterium]